MKKRIIIGIDGESTAGKSTLAGKLKEALPDAAVIGLDYFCHEKSGKEGEWWGNSLIGYGFDWERLRDQVIIPFQSGATGIQYDSFNWDTCKGTVRETLPDCNILIAEGLTVLSREMRDVFDIRIWLTSDREGQMQRLLDRGDHEMIGYFEREFFHIAQRYIAEHKPEQAADIVLNALSMTEADVRTLAGKILNGVNGNAQDIKPARQR